MEWLNYHHLLYFWAVAREGSIAAASSQLHLAPPTISAQVGMLERALGERLFAREGRRLRLTETGRVVFGYADQIFGLGRELQAAVRSHASDRPLTLVVGVVDALPKLIAYRLLEPALRAASRVRVVCREDRAERLLAELAVSGVDLVLSDSPLASAARVRAFDHVLVDCGVAFFGAPRIARACRSRFPRSLDGAPFLLPRDASPLRLSLERWFDRIAVRPRIVGEFDDSALLKTFGQAGAGIFAGPRAIETEVRRQYGVQVIGQTEEVRERFYAIAGQRRIVHPAVTAILEGARSAVGPGRRRRPAARGSSGLLTAAFRRGPASDRPMPPSHRAAPGA